MITTDTSQKNRVPQLDFLRGIAILLVLFFHTLVSPDAAGMFRPIAAPLARFGWTGVDLFFVLSGFLVGGLLLKEIKKTGRLDIPRFLIRRGLKIWPGYFALLAYVFLQYAHHNGARSALIKILPNLIHLQNYLGTIRGHTWSLAVEEHFYLLLPLLLLLLLKLRPGDNRAVSAVPMLAAVIAILCLGLRLAVVFLHPGGDWRMGETHLRVDGLFFGVFLAYAHHFHTERLARFSAHRAPLLILAAVLIAPMFFFDAGSAFVCTVGYTLLYLGYGLLLTVTVHTPLDKTLPGKLLSSRAAKTIGFIGFYSYSIYLWFLDFAQEPLRRLIEHHPLHLPDSILWPAEMAAYVALALAVGVIAAKLIEFPALTLRDRIFPARAAAPTVASTDPLPLASAVPPSAAGQTELTSAR
ncbi:MAG: acyltransferase [Tepidisphaeraceae bacterium]|jgi:peptidoglycan/LPS O-acetylase OafA/YrhL